MKALTQRGDDPVVHGNLGVGLQHLYKWLLIAVHSCNPAQKDRATWTSGDPHLAKPTDSGVSRLSERLSQKVRQRSN